MKEIGRNETYAIKWNELWKANTYHEMIPFIVLLCNKDSLWNISEIQTTNNVIYTLAENLIFNFRIYKIFFYLPALKILVPPNLCLLLRLSCILKISNVSLSSSLNKSNTFSPYGTFVPIGNRRTWVQALFSKAVQ